jgi:DNA polymerase III delta prime subunit
MSYLQHARDTIIFQFSDPYERTQTFLSKVFEPRVIQKATVVALNAPTDSVCLKVLQGIAVEEDLALNDDYLRQVRDQSGKDLRLAITMLQFQSQHKASKRKKLSEAP